MQPDNNKYILKDITEKLNQLENKQIINGFVYQNSIPLAYIEGEGFIKLKNSDFTTEIISRLNDNFSNQENLNKQKDLNKIDESDKDLIQQCIKAEIINEFNVENIEKFLTSHTLDDLKVLRSEINRLPDKVADIENIK